MSASIPLSWHLGFNDPTMVAWLTAGGYLFAALLAWRAARVAILAESQFDRLFWLATCGALVLLALNKQLDLQVLITDFGRYWALEHNLFEQRRQLQKAFVVALLLAAGIVATGLWLATRGRDLAIRCALAGMALCCGYMLVRAAAVNHADAFMRLGWFGLVWPWALELTGIALTGIGAYRYRGTPVTR